MTSIGHPGSLPDNLPLLTQVADEDVPDDLPTLTEVVTEAQPDPNREAPAAGNEASHARFPLPNPPPQAGEGANESLREFHINEEEMQRLLQRLEAHLENAFARKLSLNLEQLQRQAVEQVVNELKAELPQLLRDALSDPDSLHHRPAAGEPRLPV
jgi:hypothetical protein